MKILVINYECPPIGGGGGVAAYVLAKELADSHTVHYLTSNSKFKYKKETKDSIIIHRIPMFGRGGTTASFASLLLFPIIGFIFGIFLLRKYKTDVIHTHFAIPSGPLGIVLSKLFKKPHVLSIHGGDIYDPSKKTSPHRHSILKRVVSYVINHSDEVIAQSGNTKDNAKKYYSIKKSISVIPLPYKKFIFGKVSRKNLYMEQDLYYFVSVGRLVKRKGYDRLLKAFSRLENRDARLILIGNGPEYESLTTLTRNLKLADRVEIFIDVSNEKKFQYLSNSNCYVLSSEHEGFGIVLQEAMQAKLPIIATSNGGQTDFLENGRNALLVSFGDEDELATAMQRMLNNNNPEEYTRHYDTAMGKFDSTIIASQHLEIFTKVITENKSDANSFVENQGSYWDKKSTSYSRLSRNHKKKIQLILDILKPRDNDSILEIGIGKGEHAEAFLSHTEQSNISVQFSGIDISEEMVNASKSSLSNFSGINVQVGDGENLPFPNDSFNSIFCTATIHHLEHPYLGLKEIIRVLKAGGSFVIVEPNLWFPKNLFQTLFIKEERNNKFIRYSVFNKWAEELQIQNKNISYFLYSLPIPKLLFPVYDWMDSTFVKIPILRNLAIQLVLSGKKQLKKIA